MPTTESDEIFGLSTADVKELRQLVAYFRGTLPSTSDLPPPDDIWAMDHYMAMVPTQAGTSTPSDLLPGKTGTVPGSLSCHIYKIHVGAPSEELARIEVSGTPLLVKVYNPYGPPWRRDHGYFRIIRLKTGGYVCERPPHRYKAVADEEIAINSSGLATVWINGAASDWQITVHYNWMVGTAIAPATEMIVDWFQDEADGDGQWVITEASCA